ncbi:hypothetical protein ATO49_18825 [Mycolicibacterium fortuitum subsp. fortuitum DSM 46621 = ATCC 6841 = JCM 6387]|nr:hypothetical protein ATO49_18825 [Mycolicibacterium fortuitum subsp. fortuitum DSM 46621 = ATCC 6841 = JCM 6387]
MISVGAVTLLTSAVGPLPASRACCSGVRMPSSPPVKMPLYSWLLMFAPDVTNDSSSSAAYDVLNAPLG